MGWPDSQPTTVDECPVFDDLAWVATVWYHDCMPWHVRTQFQKGSSLLDLSVVEPLDIPKHPWRCRASLRVAVVGKPDVFSCTVGIQQFEIRGTTTHCETRPSTEGGIYDLVDTKLHDSNSRTTSEKGSIGSRDQNPIGIISAFDRTAASTSKRGTSKSFAARSFNVVDHPAGRYPRWTVSANPPGSVLHENRDIPLRLQMDENAPVYRCEFSVSEVYFQVVKCGTYQVASMPVKLAVLAKLHLLSKARDNVHTIAELYRE